MISKQAKNLAIRAVAFELSQCEERWRVANHLYQMKALDVAALSLHTKRVSDLKEALRELEAL